MTNLPEMSRCQSCNTEFSVEENINANPGQGWVLNYCSYKCFIKKLQKSVKKLNKKLSK